MSNKVQKTFTNPIIMSLENEELMEKFHDFEQTMMMYNCAIREVRTKFEVLNDDLNVTNNRNPIEMIESRIKRPMSIIGKLKRKNLEFSTESILDNIRDVAGIRVICTYVDDIYEVAKMFASQDDINVLEVKDYIKSPKPNGYRSYHMIVEIPVFFSQQKRMIKVEVQFRTIAMDFWASLEHQMKYKREVEGAEEIVKELKQCADVIAETDLKMQEISKKLKEL